MSPERPPQFEHHAFVCISGRACPKQGARDVIGALRARVKELRLTGRVRINQAGCLAQCGHGPMIVVHPDETWYAAVRPEDAERIISEHLISGRPVEELRYRPVGPGVQICNPGEEAIPYRPEEPSSES